MKTSNKKEVVRLRKGISLALTLAVCTVSTLIVPMKVEAEEVGGGETTIHIRVPDTHEIKVDIGAHGWVRINNITYKGTQNVKIERLSSPCFEIEAEKGYEINTAYYQGKDVTGEIKNNQYIAPLLYEDGNILKVDFKKSSGNASGGNTPDEGTSEGEDPSEEDTSNGEIGDITDGGSSGNSESSGTDIGEGEHLTDNGGTPGNADSSDTNIADSSKNENDPSDKKEAGGSTDTGTEQETEDWVENKKNEILNELDEIDQLLKNSDLSAEEKAELLERKQGLLEELTTLIFGAEVSNKSDIEKNLVNIEKLLARNDLTKEQRQQLEEKKEELSKQLEEMETEKKQNEMFKAAIIVVVIISGGIYIFYRKKKKAG